MLQRCCTVLLQKTAAVAVWLWDKAGNLHQHCVAGHRCRGVTVLLKGSEELSPSQAATTLGEVHRAFL